MPNEFYLSKKLCMIGFSIDYYTSLSKLPLLLSKK